MGRVTRETEQRNRGTEERITRHTSLVTPMTATHANALCLPRHTRSIVGIQRHYLIHVNVIVVRGCSKQAAVGAELDVVYVLRRW